MLNFLCNRFILYWITSIKDRVSGKIFIFSFLFFTIFILIYFKAYSQNENISFEHFTYENGLSAPVTVIAQDHYHFLWLGTTDGINRFDGKNIIVYRNVPGDTTSLPNNIINGLCVDVSGRIWIATNGGLCYYNFSDDAFHTIGFNDTLEKIDRYRVHAVEAGKDGSIWFATKTLLHVWRENQSVKTFSLPVSDNLIIADLHSDSKNRIWIGTNSGLFVFEEATLKIIQSKIYSPFSLEKKLSVTIHPIITYNLDTMIAGSWYAGMQMIYISGDSIQSVPFIDSIETDSRRHIVTGISKGQNSQWWVGTYGNGLAIFDFKTKKFTNHLHHNPSDRKSLSNDYINVVFTDVSGILWIGTSAGLDKFDPLTQQFKSVSIPSTSNEFSVYRLPGFITEDKNNSKWLWITVSGVGLFHYNTVNMPFKLYCHDEKNIYSLPVNTVYTLYYDDKGRIWLGFKSGICMFDEKSEKFTSPPIIKNEIPLGVHRILQDEKKRFWFATFSNGVYCYDEPLQKMTSYKYDENNRNSLPDNRVFSIAKDHKNKIWIGTQNRGLCCLDPQTQKFQFFQHNKKDPNSLPDNGVYDLYEDKYQHLWIATENGLSEMDLSNYKMKNYTTRDGLCNNDVFSITPDKQSHLWLATNNGLCSFDPSKSYFRNYYINDGLPENRIGGAVYCSSDGTLYFGSTGMLSFCNPENMKMNKRIPPVVITNLKIFDKQVAAMRNGEMLLPIHLTHSQNMITFDFAAMNFTNTNLNKYAYKLEGFDKNWIYCGNRQSATYTNLDGGKYTFIVKASNNDGIWNETGTHVLLVIDAPWWKTWWFYILCLLIVTGILYVFYRVRINQLLQLQHIRMRISRDLHDDIGSTLSSINIISSMADKTGFPENKSSANFKTISSASRQAIELMNDIVWSINPKNDRMDMIIIRIRQYASEMLEAANISFSIEMDEECKNLNLPVEKKKEFYLIFKEAINNLAKYSGAQKANIQLKYNNRILTLIISDNGKGFDTSEKFQGNGLKNMKARAGQLKGKFSIISLPHEGTIVTLNIPTTP